MAPTRRRKSYEMMSCARRRGPDGTCTCTCISYDIQPSARVPTIYSIDTELRSALAVLQQSARSKQPREQNCVSRPKYRFQNFLTLDCRSSGSISSRKSLGGNILAPIHDSLRIGVPQRACPFLVVKKTRVRSSTEPIVLEYLSYRIFFEVLFFL